MPTNLFLIRFSFLLQQVKPLKCFLAGLFLVCAAIFLFGFSAAAQEQNSSNYSNLRRIAINETGSRLFLLYNNSTVSVYDAEKKLIAVSHKQIPGLINATGLEVSPSGKWLALIDGPTAIDEPAAVLVFEAQQLSSSGFNDASEVFRYNLGSARRLIFRFSPDERKLVAVNTVQGEAHILDIEKRSGYKIAIGQNPVGLDFDSQSSMAFIANTGSNTVSVIDLAEKRFVSSVTVGSQPHGIIFAGRSGRIFVSNISSNSVSVIDAKSLKVLKEISVGRMPIALAYNSKEDLVFVANNADGTVSIIDSNLSARTLDLKSPAYYQEAPMVLVYSEVADRLFILNTSTARYFVYDGSGDRLISEEKTDVWPYQIAGNENSKAVFIRHFNAPTLVIDLSSMETYKILIPEEGSMKKESVFSSPQSIAIDEDTNRIYISNLGSGSIAVIDGSTQKAIATIPVAQVPQVINLNQITKKLYITSPVENVVTVIDTKSKTFSKKVISVGKMPRAIVSNEVTNKIYVSNSGDKSISVIDGERDIVMATINLGTEGSFPLLNSINKVKNEVYVSNYGGDTIAIIDGKTDTLKRLVKVGKNPVWGRYYPELDQLYVSVEGDKKVVRINPETYEVADSFTLDGNPYRIFFDPETKLIYVNLRKNETVTIIRPPKEQTGHGAILTKKSIPYFGQTDTIYNMLSTNWKSGLIYLTYGRESKVIVLKLNRIGEDKILEPIWFAEINGEGTAKFNPQFQQEVPPPSARGRWFLIGGSAVAFAVLFGLAYWFFIGRKPRPL